MTFMNKIIEAFKLESTREMENTADGFIPDAQTIYFVNGKMYKVYPTDKESWYDARYLVSDNKVYDLDNIEDIKKIPIPEFKRLENDNYGVTGLLDYVLRMKAGAFYNRNEKELCSACLWKATEMMFSDTICSWLKKDYMRLFKWHLQLGMKEEAECAKKYLESKGIIFTEYELKEKKTVFKKQLNLSLTKTSSPREKLSFVEKELIMVKSVTTEDMISLKTMPFVCNTEVKKYIHDGNHPFAYMEIIGENIEIVKSEIEKINIVVSESIKMYPKIPRNLRIPVKDIVFQSERYRYTMIKCMPKTFTGKQAKYPYILSFCTDLSNFDNQTFGELTYGKDGTIQKAHIVFWRKRNMFALNFKIIDGVLTFTDMEQGRPTW